MKRIVRHAKQLNEINKYIKDPSRYYFLKKNTNFRITEAKRLHADTYLRIGFIDDSEINTEGVISLEADPHQAHSEYFIVIDERSSRVVASARHIVYMPHKGKESFPIITNARLSDTFNNHISHSTLERYVEVSGLVKKRGTSNIAPLLLYKEMLKKSLQDGHDRWLMALDVNLYKRLSYIFGQNLQIIGSVTSYKGGDVIPLMLEPKSAIPLMRNEILLSNNPFQKRVRKNFLDFFLADKSFIFEHEKQKKQPRKKRK